MYLPAGKDWESVNCVSYNAYNLSTNVVKRLKVAPTILVMVGLPIIVGKNICLTFLNEGFNNKKFFSQWSSVKMFQISVILYSIKT